MTKKILHCISTAYRAIHEEQDDTILWLTHAMTNAGGKVDVLLHGAAVNYLASSQECPALEFGAWKQSNPPNIRRDIEALIKAGSNVYFSRQDLEKLGLTTSELIDGVNEIDHSGIVKLYEKYDLVHRF